MTTEPITPVVPPPVAVAEDQPQSTGTEAVATTNSPEDLLVQRIAVLWNENTTNRFELGKTLFELQELHAHPGSGDFIERVKAIGISKILPNGSGSSIQPAHLRTATFDNRRAQA